MTGRLEIFPGALRHNARVLRDLVAPSLAAFVVKGNAYGHGLVPVALAVEPYAARFCVYAVEEALALRAAGISTPVLVLGPVVNEALEEALAAGLEIAVWSTAGFLDRLSAAARHRGRPAAVHFKVNTDLNRLGFEPHALAGAVAEASSRPELAVTGIFSHLASAEELDSPYTMHQLAAFQGALAQTKPLLDSHGVRPLRHIAASAAAMLWPQTRLDMARLGIALYGLMPSAQTREALGADAPDLRPALAYRSEVAVVRTVEAGASIGYGGSFHAPHEMRVGVVPVGYADGVPRALSNRGAFAVEAVRCPIVGRVAMNMTQIDLSGAPGAGAGSSVSLIGRDGDVSITADDWAAWADTINYEIVTRLPSTLRRDFVD